MEYNAFDKPDILYPEMQFKRFQNLNDILEELKKAPIFYIKEKVQYLEVITKYETNNHYEVINQNNEPLMKLNERTGFCVKQCLGKARPVNSLEFLSLDKEIKFARMKRGCVCYFCRCFAFCNTFSLEKVQDAKFMPIANISQNANYCKPKFTVDMSFGKQFDIMSSRCFCLDNFYPRKRTFLSNIDDAEIIIQRKVNFKNLISDADSYSVQIPQYVKYLDNANDIILAIIGAIISIDFAYYESSGKRNRGTVGQYAS